MQAPYILAGVSGRTLQDLFQWHTVAAPRTYLRELRPARVHADPLAPEAPDATVAQIANRWGLTHLGRFAAAYRTQYGVGPSVTLRYAPPPTPFRYALSCREKWTHQGPTNSEVIFVDGPAVGGINEAATMGQYRNE